jgi:hypothetical protein
MKIANLIYKYQVIFVYLTFLNIFFVNSNTFDLSLQSEETNLMQNNNFSSDEDATKYLPFVNGKVNSEFKPIKIKFVHVDNKVELKKKNSEFDDDTYHAFYNLVMKPVAEYFEKLLKVYPLSKLKDAISPGQKCLSMFKDSHKTTRKFKVDLKEALEDNVS